MTVSNTLRTSYALAVFASACTIQQQPPMRSAATDDHLSHMSAVDAAAPRIVAAREPGADQGTPGLPPSANTAAARIAASPRHAEWVRLRGSQTPAIR